MSGVTAEFNNVIFMVQVVNVQLYISFMVQVEGFLPLSLTHKSPDLFCPFKGHYGGYNAKQIELMEHIFKGVTWHFSLTSVRLKSVLSDTHAMAIVL